MLSISAIKDANGPLYFKKKMGNLLLPKTKKKTRKKNPHQIFLAIMLRS